MLADLLGPLGLGIWGQTMHEADAGCLHRRDLGGMLADAGANGVLLGHSERRALFGETDEALSRKVPAALAAGLDPVLCVGETEQERDAGATLRAPATPARGRARPARRRTRPAATIAYEPVWAIGTGRTATPEQAQETHAEAARWLAERFGAGRRRDRPHPLRRLRQARERARAARAVPDVDGALVGGASLSAASLLAIAHAALPSR